MKRALKINVETKKVEEVFISDGIEDISKQIGNGCQYFCCPFTFDNNDTIYADDESLLRLDDVKGGFLLKGWTTPIVGNAIILGTNSEGESIDCKSTIEFIEENCAFMSRSLILDWGKHFNDVVERIFNKNIL
jgi:hypothetical protein